MIYGVDKIGEGDDKVKVLLVDDEPSMLELGKTYLSREEQSFSITTAGSVEEALKHLEEETYHIVVSDYRMPDSDGLDLLGTIRGELKDDIPFIMLTGQGREEIAMKALNLGANRYMRKGGDSGTLYGMLAKAIIQEVEHVRRTKSAEKALRESEERYRGLVETSFAGISIADLDENLIFVNDRFAEMLGYHKDELQGKHLNHISPPDQHDLYRKETEKRKKGIKSSYEGKLIKRNGDTIHVRVYANPLRDAHGEIIGTTGVITDITDLKKAQREIVRSEEQLKILCEASSVLETIDDSEELYHTSVKMAKSVLNFDLCNILIEEDGELMVKSSTEKELIGTSGCSIDGGIARRVYMEDRPELIYHFKDEILLEGEDRVRSGLYVPMTGIGVFQALSLEKEHYGKRDLEIAELLVSHIREAMDRIRAKETRNTLHTLLRHDIGNKVQVIQGYLELLDGMETQGEVGKYVSKALKSNRDCIDLIRKVGLLIRVDREDNGESDMISELHGAVEVVSKLAEFREMKISMDRTTDTCMVKGGTLLKEVFTNVLENSLYHSGGTVVRITLETEDERVICTVEDDGVGIPEGKRADVFRRGYTTDSGRGTGLGLYLAKTILNSYGGDIEVEGSEMGGAKFNIVLRVPC